VGQFGAIAVAAQVAQVDVPQFRGYDFFRNRGGGLVREVAVTTEDPLFHAPRPAPIVLQELKIMIGLEHEDACLADSFDDEFGGMPKVGEESHVARGSVNEKPDRVVGIVGYRECVDRYISDFKRGPCEKDTAFEPGLELAFDRFLGQTVAEHRDLELNGEVGQSLDMVRVFVGQENAVQRFRGTSDGSEALADLPAAESGVNEQPRFVSFQISAISRGTAPKDGEP
jgi:hypothetical protein